MPVARSTPGDNAAELVEDAHQQLVHLEAELSALWSTHLSVDPDLADQIAVAARHIRKAAAALADQRLA